MVLEFMNKTTHFIFVTIIALIVFFVEAEQFNNTNYIEFNSCEWQVDKRYKEVFGSEIIKGYVYSGDGYARAIDLYTGLLNLEQRLSEDGYEINFNLVESDLTYTSFTHKTVFSGQVLSTFYFSIQDELETIIFSMPLKESLHQFLASCLDSEITNKLIRNSKFDK